MQRASQVSVQRQERMKSGVRGEVDVSQRRTCIFMSTETRSLEFEMLGPES